jgi:hypothetical protein
MRYETLGAISTSSNAENRIMGTAPFWLHLGLRPALVLGAQG